MRSCFAASLAAWALAALPTASSHLNSTLLAGQCNEAQRKSGCADGFCSGAGCECFANYERSGSGCAPSGGQKSMTFYMYRALAGRSIERSGNVDLASLSGVVWYLHNEVVIQSCPRHFNVERVGRVKVTVFNPQEMYTVRKSLFGPFAIFDAGGCHDCEETIFQQHGYVVGCETPSASDAYTWNGYKPIWYSLPGSCPSQPYSQKTRHCKHSQRGGQCYHPDGRQTCTWNYRDAGEVSIDELYGRGFDMGDYCSKLGGKGIPGEYDRATDKGKNGISFWDGRFNATRNAQRVEALRALFKAKFPHDRDLPEPWCDWAAPVPLREAASTHIVV